MRRLPSYNATFEILAINQEKAVQFNLDDAVIAYDYTPAQDGLPPVLFLHGALGVRAHMEPVRKCFADRGTISVDFPSHGESTARRTSMDPERLARDVLALLDELKVEQVDVIGHSMGGYIGMTMAQLAPQRVRSVVTLGTKFWWTSDAVAMTLKDLDADNIRNASQKFYDALAAAHAPNGLDETLCLMRTLIEGLGQSQPDPAPFRASGVPILMCTGDRDAMVPVTEVARLFEALDSKRNAMAVLPNTPHALQHVALGCFEQSIRRFWERSLG